MKESEYTNKNLEYADAEYLDLLWRDRTEDIKFYVEEAKKSGGPVLELGFGTGRIGFEIADWPSPVPVVGLEYSKYMLMVARDRRAKKILIGEKVAILEGDMRDFTVLIKLTKGVDGSYYAAYERAFPHPVWNFLSEAPDPEVLSMPEKDFVLPDGTKWDPRKLGLWGIGERTLKMHMNFPLIIIPFRGFQHLLTPEDQRKCLKICYKHLAVGGRLILDLFDPDPKMSEIWPLNSEVIVKEVTDAKSGVRIVRKSIRTKQDHKAQVFEETHTTEVYRDSSDMPESIETPLSLRWTYRYEMEHLLESCGFEIEAVYGDFDRRPYEDGEEQIWIVSKA